MILLCPTLGADQSLMWPGLTRGKRAARHLRNKAIVGMAGQSMAPWVTQTFGFEKDQHEGGGTAHPHETS